MAEEAVMLGVFTRIRTVITRLFAETTQKDI
jgi:hypothetical protein